MSPILQKVITHTPNLCNLTEFGVITVTFTQNKCVLQTSYSAIPLKRTFIPSCFALPV